LIDPKPHPTKRTALGPGPRSADPRRVSLGAQGRDDPRHRGDPPGPEPARRHFDQAHIEELAESIRSKGVLLPLIVRRDSEGYVLVAGERRWRAAQKAGLRELPVMVREVTARKPSRSP